MVLFDVKPFDLQALPLWPRHRRALIDFDLKATRTYLASRGYYLAAEGCSRARLRKQSRLPVLRQSQSKAERPALIELTQLS